MTLNYYSIDTVGLMTSYICIFIKSGYYSTPKINIACSNCSYTVKFNIKILYGKIQAILLQFIGI